MNKKIFSVLMGFLILIAFFFFRSKRLIIQNSTKQSMLVELYVNNEIIVNDKIEPGVDHAKLVHPNFQSFNNIIRILVKDELGKTIHEELSYNIVAHKGLVFGIEESSKDFEVTYSKSYLFTPYIQ